MLVLTRKHQEKIHIGDHITITVIRTKGKSVRLGIEAPPEVPVIRGELVFHEHLPESENVVAGLREIVLESDEPVIVANSHPRRTEPAWPTSPQSATDPRPLGRPASHVSLQRIPRDQAMAALPALKSKGGPLREMLDRRALTA